MINKPRQTKLVMVRDHPKIPKKPNIIEMETKKIDIQNNVCLISK